MDARGHSEPLPGKRNRVLCEIRALLMVIGPPYDCRVTFDDRADLIVSYCIRRPTTLTGTFEARVFQTIPTSFFLLLLLFRRRERHELEITLKIFPRIGVHEGG